MLNFVTGIQTVAVRLFRVISVIFYLSVSQDAVLAAKAGVDGIIISNHGGKPIPPTVHVYQFD